MSLEKEKSTLDWQGITLSVTFDREWLGTEFSHIEVMSPMVRWTEGSWTGASRQPLPISDTGYRSIFVSADILDEWGGPLPYLAAMLDDEATRPEWIAAQAKRQQLTLF